MSRTRYRGAARESTHRARESRADPRVHTRARIRAPEHGSMLEHGSAHGAAAPHSGADPCARCTVPCSDRGSAPRAADPRVDRGSVRGPADPRSGADPRARRAAPCSDRVSAPQAADPRADRGSVRRPMAPRPSVDHVTDVRNRARAWKRAPFHVFMAQPAHQSRCPSRPGANRVRRLSTAGTSVESA